MNHPIPEVPKGGHIVGFGHGPRSQFEVSWAHNRPRTHRPPAVAIGDRVLYRSNDWTEPVVAIVVGLAEIEGDPNTMLPGGLPHPDPWPSVILRIDPDQIPDSWDKRQRGLARLAIQCQEARLEGSAGYLHPDWHLYPQPRCGSAGF